MLPRLTSAYLALVLLGCDRDAPEPISERSGAPSSELLLEVGGASVALPRGAAPPDRALARRILAPYRLNGGPRDPAVEIRRTPDGALVVLQHTTETLVARGGENAGAFLEEVLDEQLRATGIAPADPRVTRRRRDGAVQRCFSGVVEPPRTLASCTSAYIDEAGTEIVLDTVRCEADPSGAATCARVADTLASRGAKLSLDRTLEATRSPGLPEVTADAFAWIRLGATRAELEAACRDAGGRLEAPDTHGAPPALLEAVAAGRFMECAEGGSTSLGPIELVHASFDERSRLVQAGVWIPTDHGELTATLERAYPDSLPAGSMGMTAYFVNRHATDYGLLAITSAPSTARPGRTLLQVTSRRGYDSAPL